MTDAIPITALFLDIGGVLLTNGWDHAARRQAAETFGLDFDEIEERHHLTFDTYEVGKLSLDEYLKRTVFYQPRAFSAESFRRFMHACSRPYPEMIEMVRRLKARYRLKVVTVSNEGRELTVYRIENFGLAGFVDCFVSSCFVHYRKPDEDIFRIALDIAQVRPERAIYVDDRRLFVEVAGGLGIHGICHRDYQSTRGALEGMGLSLEQGASVSA